MIAGRYRVERPLGHGAMATVDLAHDLELDRRVALKRLAENLARDDELRARFLREARLAARLGHPNVVRVFDVGDDGDRPFIAMEYVDGVTLAEYAAARAPLPLHEIADLGVQMCKALAAAHEAGLVHRDVKPHNLLRRRDGLLKLGDFGIAFGVEGTRLTTAGTVLGTAAYLAPEQARGEEVAAAADIYAVGAVLYELTTGRPPRSVSTLAELSEPARIVPPDGPLAPLVMRCLAADPWARPASAAELARELAAFLPEGRTLPLPEQRGQTPGQRGQTPPGSDPRRVRPAVGLLAVAVGAIAGGVIALVATRDEPPPQPRPVARILPVPQGEDAQQQAANFAAWLRRYSR